MQHGNRRYYLREWRDKRGWSQEQLEAKSGVTQTTISDIENHPHRERKRVTVSKLAEALGIDWDQLHVDPNAGSEEVPKDPREMSVDELWEGFDALYMGGELSDQDIVDRLVRLRIEMQKRGIK